jgi:hypothetical protein
MGEEMRSVVELCGSGVEALGDEFSESLAGDDIRLQLIVETRRQERGESRPLDS